MRKKDQNMTTPNKIKKEGEEKKQIRNEYMDPPVSPEEYPKEGSERPSNQNVRKCVVTKETIMGSGAVLIREAV